ncbi:hypothetical protein SESBI_40783 [Sesbania bispinosa]|nr:hypothetical protein SESBI_40783 [Sesbania bispinosa]
MEITNLSTEEEVDLIKRSTKKIKVESDVNSSSKEQNSEMIQDHEQQNSESTEPISLSYKESLMQQPGMPKEPLFEINDIVFPHEDSEEERDLIHEEHHQGETPNGISNNGNIDQGISNSQENPMQNDQVNNNRQESPMQQNINSNNADDPSNIHPETPDNPYGPWMLVKRPPRRRINGNQDKDKEKGVKSTGSRFNILDCTEENSDSEEKEVAKPVQVPE